MSVVTVKLSIGSISIEVSGPQEYVDSKFLELALKYIPEQARNVNLIQPFESPIPTSSLSEGKKVSPAEFLRKISHTSQLDRALALGYYMERMQAMQSFTTKDLAELSRQVKYPFANVSESVSRLVGRGLMMSAGDKDGSRAYALTATGEQMIDSMAATAKV